MKIKKIYQGELPENKILNTQSTSQTDTYSCEYINNLGKSIITAYSTQNVDMSTGETLAFDYATTIGSKFTLENGKIKIGSGVRKVKLTGQIWYYPHSTTRQWFTMQQNTTIMNQMIAYTSNYFVMSFSSKLIDVNEGDVFCYVLYNLEGTGKLTVNNGAAPKTMTYITIEEV